jgi:hypothetical protein
MVSIMSSIERSERTSASVSSSGMTPRGAAGEARDEISLARQPGRL